MKIIEGVFLMIKQLFLALVMSLALVITVPVLATEATTPVEESVGFKDRVAGMWSRTTKGATELKDGIFNSDERVNRAQATIDTQKEIIAQLQNELNNLRIKTEVEHLQMVRAAQNLTQYLQSLNVEESDYGTAESTSKAGQ